MWSGKPTARQLFERLDKFEGIGQKKAAMAVEILERDLGVPISAMHGSDIAYDVHVRRVFLRTGLVEPAMI
jgi:endonuclease-3